MIILTYFFQGNNYFIMMDWVVKPIVQKFSLNCDEIKIFDNK